MKLKDFIKKVIIIAHKEDTAELEVSLAQLGVPVNVQRMEYSQTELQFPAITRCLLNHNKAWEIASCVDGYTLICEADFVPVVNFGETVVDFMPLDGVSWAHLYTSSPRILKPFDGFIRAHAATTVAYVVNANVASMMRGFLSYYETKYGFESKAPWDVHLQWYVMGKGGQMYVPLRSLGEHGGIANPEHRATGMSHFGTHRADSIASALAFRPVCAKRARYLYFGQRVYFKLIAFLKIPMGKWVNPVAEFRWTLRDKFVAYIVGVRRLF